jgi:hypothetical protein
MRRTTIMLPGKLKNLAETEARRQGVSLGQFIRASMQERLGKANGRHRDPLFADSWTFRDNLPGDVSENLDKYLDQIMDEEAGRWRE